MASGPFCVSSSHYVVYARWGPMICQRISTELSVVVRCQDLAHVSQREMKDNLVDTLMPECRGGDLRQEACAVRGKVTYMLLSWDIPVDTKLILRVCVVVVVVVLTRQKLPPLVCFRRCAKS